MNNNVSEATDRFLASCGREYAFPAGGSVKLLTPEEQSLYCSLQEKNVSETDKVSALSGGRDSGPSYDIVIFGVRLAILAIREELLDAYRCGLLALIAGGPKIDWRDTLAAFSIFDFCAARLGLSFREELETSVELANESGLDVLRCGYFERPEEMRTLSVFGVAECSSEFGVTFVRY